MATIRLHVAAVIVAVLASSAAADDGLLHLGTRVAGVQKSTSHVSVDDPVDALKGSKLQALDPEC